MIYAGIDIAKLSHFAYAISSDDEELINPFKFTNAAKGFQPLSSHLDSLLDDSFTIGLESTAYYGSNLVSYLINYGHKVCAINPIQTSSLRKKNIQENKTDKVDTYH